MIDRRVVSYRRHQLLDLLQSVINNHLTAILNCVLQFLIAAYCPGVAFSSHRLLVLSRCKMNSTMRRRLSLPIAAIEKLEKELPKIGKEIIIEVLEKSERRFSTISETEGTEDKVSPGSLLHWDPKLIRQVLKYHDQDLKHITSIFTQMMVVWAVDFLQFNSGYGIGVTSPMIAQLTSLYLDTEAASSWFASSLVIGQILGSVLGGGLANKLGRKRTCMLAAVASSLGWALLAASQNSWMLIVGRILIGFFDCLSLSGGYMYIAEVSETRLRGSFLNSAVIFSGLGIAFAYLFGSTLLWRYCCFTAIAMNLIAIITMTFCFESPLYLLMNNQVHNCKKDHRNRMILILFD